MFVVVCKAQFIMFSTSAPILAFYIDHVVYIRDEMATSETEFEIL